MKCKQNRGGELQISSIHFLAPKLYAPLWRKAPLLEMEIREV